MRNDEVAFGVKRTSDGRQDRLVSSRLTLNGNRASPDRIHKIPLNVVCDKVPGLLPKSRGPFATWGQAEEPGVAFEGCAEDSVVQR